MSLFDNVEKLINEHGSASILRERLLLAEDKYLMLERKISDLQSESTLLRVQLEESLKENADLRKSIEKPSAKPDGFDKTTEKILKIFFDVSDDISSNQIAKQLGLKVGVVDYHFDVLKCAKMIIQTRMGISGDSGSSPPGFGLLPAGREYVVKNNITLHARR